MPLQGNLKDMSLANLIQVNCQGMRTARLMLSHQGQSATVFISDGQVVHAEDDSGQGEEVFYRTLDWHDGTFTLDTDIPSPARTIKAPWSTLLLEGMKRVSTRPSLEKRSADNPSRPNLNADLVKRLKKIEGVAGVVLASSDGIVLNADLPEGDGEPEAAIAIFIGGAARHLSDTLRVGRFQHGVVFWENRRVIVLENSDRFCGLVLGQNCSPAIAASAAASVFKQVQFD